MTLTFQDVLNEAKRLSNRLKDHEGSADTLVAEIQMINEEMNAMKIYNEEITEMNQLANPDRPRSLLISSIQQESKHIMSLQQENRDLKLAIDEFQNAIDLIMSKYREQVAKLKQSHVTDDKILANFDSYNKVLENNINEMIEMKYVMNRAVIMDEESIAREEELISRLWTENKGLREMLEIAEKFGQETCTNTSNTEKDTEDKGVQFSLDDLNTNNSSS